MVYWWRTSSAMTSKDWGAKSTQRSHRRDGGGGGGGGVGAVEDGVLVAHLFGDDLERLGRKKHSTVTPARWRGRGSKALRWWTGGRRITGSRRRSRNRFPGGAGHFAGRRRRRGDRRGGWALPAPRCSPRSRANRHSGAWRGCGHSRGRCAAPRRV